MFKTIKEILYIINKRPLSMLYMSLIFFIGAITEVLTIVFLAKYLTLLIESSSDNYIVRIAHEYVPSIGYMEIMSYAGVVLIFLFTLKSIITFNITKYILRFSFNSTSVLINRLFKSYVERSTGQKTLLSSAMQNITNHVFIFINQGLISLLKITSETVFLVVILAILINQNVNLTVFVAIGLLSIFLLFNYVFTPLIKKYSLYVNSSQKDIINTVQDALLGFDEVLVYSLSQSYRNKLQVLTDKYKHNMTKFTVIEAIPRIAYEYLISIFIILYILIAISFGDHSKNIIESMVMFSIVAVRIIPTISQISTHVNNIKYSSVARQHLLTELTGSRQNTHKERKFPTNSMQDQKVMSLCLEGISYSYRKDMAVLDNINFCVDRGSIVGIQGPSGSGKSTLAKIILGLISHKEGSINVNGRLIENIDELRSYVSYVPQHPYIFDGTVEYNICLNQPVNKDKIENILEITNLTFLADRMDEHLSNEESTLSVGQVQRLGIARALYSSRDIMIFDEPSSALDSDSENLIKQTLNQIKRDKVIVIISHSDNMLSICDYIHIMKTNLPQ